MKTIEVIESIKDKEIYNLLNASGKNYIRRSGNDLYLIIDGKNYLGINNFQSVEINSIVECIENDLIQFKTLNWGLDPKMLNSYIATTQSVKNREKSMSNLLHHN